MISRSNSPIVRLDGLSKRFPVRRGWLEGLRHPARRVTASVLQDVTCDIREGEFFGLLGPNGAGKTTLFKILATLILPDGGTATVAGHDVVGDAAAVRRVLTPVITDERSLYWRLSAIENLRLYAALHGLHGDAGRRRVAEVLEAVGLADTGPKSVGAFSSGMKQRILIARALLSRPSVLLLDEPTRSLDPISARNFRQFLRDEVSGRQGCTVVLATHSAEEALGLCDRVAVLDRGHLLAIGPARELARRYGEERYCLWTRDPTHPAWTALEERGDLRKVIRLAPGDEGWARVETEIAGGLDGTAEVLRFLACAGATVGRLERVDLSLADVIERIVAKSTTDRQDA